MPSHRHAHDEFLSEEEATLLAEAKNLLEQTPPHKDSAFLVLFVEGRRILEPDEWEGTKRFVRDVLKEEETLLLSKTASQAPITIPALFQPTTSPSPRETAIARATMALDFVSMLVPMRLEREEIGDALERINAMAAAGRPSWFIYLKVATASWWVAWHSLIHYAERIAGIIGKATGGKGE